MLLNDGEIRSLIKSGVLSGASENNVGPVSYDLTTEEFYDESGPHSTYELMPGQSVFVGSSESIHLPNDVVARVLLRNSRIRQGLDLEAPLYFPGHSTTVYFRVTNLSGSAILLDTKKGIAQITFERLERAAEKPYSGAFSNEFNYRGLGDYSNAYEKDMRQLEKKADELAGIEKRMYGNVLALMTVFAAIFSLVNVNLSGAMSGADATQIIILNLATIGSFSLLAALIASIVRPKERWAKIVPWAVAIAAFAGAIVLAFV